MMRPERTAARGGANGDSPSAMRSALTKVRQSDSCGRNSRAKVVFPAPLGPATIRILLPAASGSLLLLFGIAPAPLYTACPSSSWPRRATRPQVLADSSISRVGSPLDGLVLPLRTQSLSR